MKKLQVLLLGPPEVRWGSEKIDILRRIPRAILFYLASKGVPVGREELCSLFWDDIADARARRRLQENLSRLRKALPDPDLLHTNKDSVELDSARVYVDSLDFEKLINQTGKTPQQIPVSDPLPDPIAKKLESAANLWRGSSFLSGSYFPGTIDLDNWLTRTSSHLAYLRGSIFERIANHAYSNGDFQKTISYSNSVLEIEPFNDNFHFLVIRSLIDLGRIEAAKVHFERTIEQYNLEGNIDLPEKISALSKYITPALSDSLPSRPPQWQLHQTMEVPFVGRKDTLSEIRRWLNQHKGVIILGESGSGKTRLIRKYTNDLSLAIHARILISNCRPEETTFPLHPIRELLRRHMTNDEWLALPTVWASNLLAIYPELVELRPDLIQAQLPSDPDHAQGLLFEAIRQAFIIMSVDTPLFVVIDDLHWADEATLNSLAYFLPRTPFSKQASLIAAARLESITPQLKTLQNSIQQSKDGVVINLPELTRNDIADLAKSILETEPSPNFLDHLTRSSGGNSLYVLEILRAIIDTKPGHDFSKDITLPVTENLRKLISSRIQKLSDPTRQILEAASILGYEFDPKIIFAIMVVK